MTPRILIVDDETDLREAFVDVLKASGFEACGAADGETALALLRDGPGSFEPTVVLFDLMMPGMNGWQLVEELRRIPRMSGVALVVISAHPNLEAVAQEIGASGYAEKPVTMEQLLAVVQRCRPGDATASRG